MGLRDATQDNQLFIFIGKNMKMIEREASCELGGKDTLSAKNKALSPNEKMVKELFFMVSFPGAKPRGELIPRY